MGLCNAHYYSSRDPLGAEGDFTTAPEISQMFGEIVGAALADCWIRAGAPASAVYAEPGPGRGTLAADALRVLRIAGFAGDVHFVETSPSLRRRQSDRVPDAHWHDAIDELPCVPLLMVANEFFDALPVRQWVRTEERGIMVGRDRLAFTIDGKVREDSPAREAAVTDISRHIAERGGIALVIDYGHVQSADGDTLQAVRGHRYADVLEAPGEADLTSHVDFAALSKVAVAVGANVTNLVPQGQWLERLGIRERTVALAASQPERAGEITAAVHRLCNAAEMGTLFKVIAIHAPNWPVPAGFY